MNEQQKAKTKAVETSEAGFILTKSGVMIVGEKLLGDKLLGIMCAAIKQDVMLHGLCNLTIHDDNFPIEDATPVFGMAYADTNSMAINLEYCWHRACVKAHKGDVNLSFMGILWVNLLSTLAHELDHLTIAINDRELYETQRLTEEGLLELEDSANGAGEPMMIELAKLFDIEPPSAGDFGWFSAKFMKLFSDESTKDLEWVIKARKDLEDGIIYAEPENDIEIKTFRDFVKKGFDNDGQGGGWDQPTTAVNLLALLDNGVVEEFKAEPVVEAAVETVVLETADVPAEAVAMTANAAGTFVGAGETAPEIGDAALQALMDAPNPQPITPAVVAGKAGREHVVACPNPACNKPLDASWNACPHCETVVDAEGLAEVRASLAAAPATVEVPLPAAVVAQAATTTAAATTATPPAQETPTTYTPHNLTPEVQAAVMQSVWKLLYHHVFTKCGWQQNPQTGRFMFINAAAVLEGVNIQSILTQYGTDNFIMEYDTLDAEGKYAAEMCQGMIRGRTTSKQGLPSYSLYLNVNGQRIKRSFIPQNPEKMTNNAYTKSADEAAGGHMIVWVFKDEVPDNAPFSQKCAVTIKDNVYEIMS